MGTSAKHEELLARWPDNLTAISGTSQHSSRFGGGRPKPPSKGAIQRGRGPCPVNSFIETLGRTGSSQFGRSEAPSREAPRGDPWRPTAWTVFVVARDFWAAWSPSCLGPRSVGVSSQRGREKIVLPNHRAVQCSVARIPSSCKQASTAGARGRPQVPGRAQSLGRNLRSDLRTADAKQGYSVSQISST